MSTTASPFTVVVSVSGGFAASTFVLAKTSNAEVLPLAALKLAA
jgi:hypothetical protein